MLSYPAQGFLDIALELNVLFMLILHLVNVCWLSLAFRVNYAFWFCSYGALTQLRPLPIGLLGENKPAAERYRNTSQRKFTKAKFMFRDSSLGSLVVELNARGW